MHQLRRKESAPLALTLFSHPPIFGGAAIFQPMNSPVIKMCSPPSLFAFPFEGIIIENASCTISRKTNLESARARQFPNSYQLVCCSPPCVHEDLPDPVRGALASAASASVRVQSGSGAGLLLLTPKLHYFPT